MPDISRLRSEWGLDFARVRRVLAGFADGESVSELVASSGLPRRDVESVLDGLDVADFGDMKAPSTTGDAELEAR